MCNEKSSNCSSCVADILKVILVLQQNACPDSCLDSCDRPMLGGGPNCLVCNTRPIQLYTCCGNGTPWSMSTNRDNVVVCSNPQVINCNGECSTVFRVEKLDGCCATFRVLEPNPQESCCNSMPYVATNSFFTMDLSCVCAVKCLSDTYVDCV